MQMILKIILNFFQLHAPSVHEWWKIRFFIVTVCVAKRKSSFNMEILCFGVYCIASASSASSSLILDSQYFIIILVRMIQRKLEAL